MRKFFLIVCFAFTILVGAPSKSQITTLPVFIYGNSTAPLEVIEFCSMYCPACDYFKHTTFSDIEKQYCASNQIGWIRIPFAIDFGDVLMLAYMKRLPQEQLLAVDEWYKAFRDKATFKNEDEFHEKLLTGLKETFSIFKNIQRAQPEEIDSIVQETIRLVEYYKLKDYPSVLIEGHYVSVSNIKEVIGHKLKQLKK